ncbi:MAG TPA: sigma-70 family RNA polymerase sigma factor [Vicinamibacteria bacterium]|nr:sigma-70 family RNA polymerase sigma factor [Vicinamibacteria bacterium]
MEPSDRELMAALASGDRDALSLLMERHYRRIYRVALSYLRDPDEALDVVQETFVKAFQHAARWDARSEVGSWLTRIGINQAIDRYRRVRRRRASEEPIEDGAGDHDRRWSDSGPSPERQVMGHEMGARLAGALRGLPERQRAIVVLRHYEEMTLEEIARTLGLSLGTVKSSLHRAVHRLRERLGELRA